MATSTRFTSVDALRGLIMMLMAIDHTNAFVARQHGGEFWNGALAKYDSAFAFLTRFVTHLCAPGFFFLMGAGIYWFATSRQASGWTAGLVTSRLAVRGFLILLIGQFLENPIIYLQGRLAPPAKQLAQMPMMIPFDGTEPFTGFITLSALGSVLMLCALLVRLPPAGWLIASALGVIATHALVPANGQVGPAWLTVLLFPGISQHILVVYAVIPWLAVAAFGMYCGHIWQSRPGLRDKAWWLGLAMIVLAIALRANGGWGNLLIPRDNTWIEFLNNVKYPPSLVFWTLSVGIDLVILGILMRAPQAITSSRSPFIVFGQTPLFFYVVHFYVLGIIAFAFFRQAAPLEAIYLVWPVVLAIMYPLCIWYRNFKMRRPAESFWRML